MRQDKVLGLLGIARKAGKTGTGSFCAERDVKAGKAFLVVAANDASERSKKEFRNMCAFYKVPLVFYGTKETLGAALGKEYCVACAITDEGLAKSVGEQAAPELQED